MVNIYEDKDVLSQAAADNFVELAQKSIQKNGRFTVALSGGSSPRECYELLSTHDYKDRVEWDKVFVFWGDERYVPETDKRNNAKMAIDAFLSKVPIPDKNIFRIPFASTPEKSASEYDKMLHKFFKDQEPVFDLIHLGLGENGHTASLFPETDVLDEKDKWVSEVFVVEQDMYRVTLTEPVINKARNIVFLVYGENKAEIVYNVIAGPKRPREWPAQLINPVQGNLYWFLDEAAASVYVQNQ